MGRAGFEPATLGLKVDGAWFGGSRRNWESRIITPKWLGRLAAPLEPLVDPALTPWLAGGGSSDLGRSLSEKPRELRTRPNPQLAVDVTKVELDCLRTQEERRGRFSIARPSCDNQSHLKLLRRQLISR